MSYFVIASVVCSTEVGGLQSDVAFFDTDRKLNVDVLALIISQRLSSIQDPQKRSQLYNEALNRVKVYRPKDMTHLALFLCAIRNNHSYSPRLIVLDSLSAYLYDLGNNETLQSTFRSILHHFRCLLREKKCSLILISPSTQCSNVVESRGERCVCVVLLYAAQRLVFPSVAPLSARESGDFLAHFQRERRAAGVFLPNQQRRAALCIMKTTQNSLFVIPHVRCIDDSYSNRFSGGSFSTSFFQITGTACFSCSIRDAVLQLNRINVGNPNTGSITLSRNWTVTGSIMHPIMNAYLKDSRCPVCLSICLSCKVLPRDVAR